MYKRQIVIVLALLATAVVAGAGWGIFSSRALAAESAQGVVMSAGSGGLVVVPAAGDLLEFGIAPSARITRDGETVELRELQPKDQVSVSYTSGADGLMATEINARSPY